MPGNSGGKAPVSCLQVDVSIGQAGRVTLSEVEALDALEPYGAGNARPVFCLRGPLWSGSRTWARTGI